MHKIPYLVTAFFLGLNSGINYASIGASLTLYLNDYHIDLALLGFLSLRQLPYSFKGLWSPVMDITPLRVFKEGFGHRKSWLIPTQLLLVCCYLTFAYFNNPDKYLIMITLTAVIAAFLAATYDNALHGYRIELFEREEQSKGNSIIALSFKIGFYISLTSALVLSQYFSWKVVFCLYAFSMVPCIIIVWFSDEKKKITYKLSFSQTIRQLRKNYLEPFKFLLKKPFAFPIIIIVIFIKASDSFMDTLLLPYLLEMGFTKVQAAGYGRTVGFISYMIGTTIGGYILYKNYNIIKLLIFVEILSAVSNLGFVSFCYSSNDSLLMLVSFFESLSSSMCNIVLITFMSIFCKSTIRFTATFFAILQSFSLLNRLIISSFSGVTVEAFGWQTYLIISSLLSIPTLIACYYLLVKTKENALFQKTKEVR